MANRNKTLFSKEMRHLRKEYKRNRMIFFLLIGMIFFVIYLSIGNYLTPIDTQEFREEIINSENNKKLYIEKVVDNKNIIELLVKKENKIIN